MRKDAIQICKAACAAVIFALVYALLFALVINIFGIGASAVKTVNQVFKILSIIFGGLIFLRGERGLIKGAAFGAAAYLLTYFLFCAIAGAISFGWMTIAELLIGAAAGAITGAIAVNLKKE